MGRPRTRALVEEFEGYDVIPARPIAKLVRRYGHIARAFPLIRRWDPNFPHLTLAGYRTRYGVVWCLVCDRCGRRRRSLYRVEGRWACRLCHNLYYASQARRWDLPLLERLSARTDTLRHQPGPKGRRFRAWRQRAARIESLAARWAERWMPPLELDLPIRAARTPGGGQNSRKS